MARRRFRIASVPLAWLRLACLAWFASSLAACSEKPPPRPPSYLSGKGTVMPLRSALDEVSFRPYVPSRQVVETAVIPAYNGGDDTRENRGIAFEYVSAHESFALSEWPGSGQIGPISIPAERGCSMSGYRLGRKPQQVEEGHTPQPLPPQTQQGVMWSTRGMVYNLVPTGNATPQATVAEARRLIRTGACR